MSEYVLHGFAQSGNCYKVALTLTLAAADWTPRFVDYFHGETRSAAYREKNEMGEAPMLEHRGLLLTQSGVILDYLTGTLGRFGATSEEERREVWRWLLYDNHKLTSYTATYRFLRTFGGNGPAIGRPEPDRAQLPPATDPAVLEWLRTRAETAWGVLNAHLARRTYVVGERLTIADLSMCGYLFFDDEIGVDWADYPNIDAWLRRIRETPRWAHPYDLLPGHPLPARTGT